MQIKDAPLPEILRVLGMSPEEWGKLPPEYGTINALQTTTGVSSDRTKLRTKALELLQKEEDAKGESSLSIHERLDNLEKTQGDGSVITSMNARLAKLENNPNNSNFAASISELNSRITELERKVGKLQSENDSLSSTIATLNTNLSEHIHAKGDNT